jgi:hypothetical protein
VDSINVRHRYKSILPFGSVSVWFSIKRATSITRPPDLTVRPGSVACSAQKLSSPLAENIDYNEPLFVEDVTANRRRGSGTSLAANLYCPRASAGSPLLSAIVPACTLFYIQ